MKKLLFLTFCISVFLLSCKPEKKATSQAVKLLETNKSWDGNTLPDYPVGSPQITALKVIIPPKEVLKIHKHPLINMGVMLKGELTVITENNDTLNLKAGDPIIEVVNTWHYGKNESNEIAEIIVFYVGTKGEALSIVKEED